MASGAYYGETEAVTLDSANSQVAIQDSLAPARGYVQHPASVEMAMPARLAASPHRYRAPQVAQFSPARGGLSSSSTVAMPPAWPVPESYTTVAAMQPAEHERVQVGRQFGRSPDMVLRDMGLSNPGNRRTPSPKTAARQQQQQSSQPASEYRRTASPMADRLEPTASFAAPPVVDPAPPQVTVVEKVIEQQGMSAQEMQVWLQGERSRLSGAIQEIMTQQSKTLTEVLNEEVHKVIHMVNAVSNSCEERLVRLEADRSARASAFQGLKRDVDGLQAQIGDLEQFRMIGTKEKDQAAKDEVMTVLESVTKDVRNQHRSVLSGLSAQKELQQKLEGALAEVRSDIETLASEVSNQRSTMLGLSSQKDLLILQKDQQTIDKAIVELRRQTQQSLEVVRTELANEVLTLRQTHFGGLQERIAQLEAKRLDQDVQELTRLIHTERSGRNDLAQSLESYRASHLQTVAELRAEMDTWPEKLSRMEMAVVEERGSRERSLLLEQTINEVKSNCSRRFGDIEAKLETQNYVSKDVTDLKKTLSIEQSERSDLAESFETHRKTQQQMNSQFRDDVERALQELRREASSSSSKAQVLEKAEQDLRATVSKHLSDMHKRIDICEANGASNKEAEELTKLVRAENAARVDISQTLDAYRMAHLQTSTELRADLDVALEKLSRLESVNQALRPGSNLLSAPQAGQRVTVTSASSSRLGLSGSVLAASRSSGQLGTHTAGLFTLSSDASGEAANPLTPASLLTPWAASEDIKVTTTTTDATGSTTSPGWTLQKKTSETGGGSSSLGLGFGGLGGGFEEARPDEANTSAASDRLVALERMDASLSAASADLGGPLLGGGLLGSSEEGSLLGRGLRSSASAAIASEVAEVLADDRRLLGRGLRISGSR